MHLQRSIAGLSIMCAFSLVFCGETQKTSHVLGGKAAPTGLRHYLDPETGVSLRYPPNWDVDSAEGVADDPMLSGPYERSDPPKARLQIGWESSSPAGEPDESYVQTGNFAYAVLPLMTAKECREVPDGWLEKDADKVIGGVRFHHVSGDDAGLGHSLHNDVYTVFRHGVCLGFQIGEDAFRSDDPSRRQQAGTAAKASVRKPMDADDILATVRFVPIGKAQERK